jgi:glycosyltransferase involved in cell wall biosynthesis
VSIKLTIGVISYNRKKYMKSLLKSLEYIKDDSEIQVVVVDNGSTEEGLVEMLKSSDVIDDLHLGEKKNWINDEYIAKNKITDLCRGDVLFSMQDDRQLLVTSKYLKLYAQDLLESHIPTMGVDAVRRITVSSRVDPKNCLVSQKTGCKYWINLNNKVGTTGLFIVDVLREMGPYPVDWPVEKEYWGRSEDVFNEMIWSKYPGKCVSIRSHIPLVAGVWNDPRGGQAFIRGDTRYGVYLDAPDKSGLYYEMLIDHELDTMMKFKNPLSFVEVCKPIGWKYAKDETGDQKKFSQKDVMNEGPFAHISSSNVETLNSEIIKDDDSNWVDDWMNS